MTKKNNSKVQTIYVLLPAGDPSTTYWLFQPFIAGIHTEIPDVDVHFTFIPENEAVTYVQELIDGPRASGQLAGVVAVSCPSAVYRYLAELRVPAMVYGSMYSSELPISSMDIDCFQGGQLLTQYLIATRTPAHCLSDDGRRPAGQSLVPRRDHRRTGHGGTVSVRVDPAPDPQRHRDIAHIAKELLEKPDRPTAIITRGSAQVEAVASVVAEAGLDVPNDLEIVFDYDQTTLRPHTPPYPWVQATVPLTEIAAMMGKMLKEMAGGVPAHPKRVVIPMELHEPPRKRARRMIDDAKRYFPSKKQSTSTSESGP